MQSAAPTTARGGTVLGTGLSLQIYVALVVASIVMFLFWGGPLWNAEAGTSQAGRFFLSYLAVIPAAAALLWWRHRFTWWRLGTTVGTVWAIKLLATAGLYYLLAPGGIVDHAASVAAPAVTHRASATPVARPGYAAATADFPRADLTVSVEGGAPFIALLEAPRSGTSLPGGRDLSIELTAAGFSSPHYLATTEDALRVHNASNALHAIKLSGPSAMNRPTPAGATIPLVDLEQGVYQLGCATHAGEHALLVVVDHPYAALGGAEGARLVAAPAGSLHIVALQHDGVRLKRFDRSVEVGAGDTLLVHFP